MSDQDHEQMQQRPLSNRVFLEVEHVLYVALAVLLGATCLLSLAEAALTFWQGLSDWHGAQNVFEVIDRLLVVLMLIEILHTVLVSVRSGTLVCEPFLIVGLIASIRRVLVITLESSQVTNGSSMSSGDMRLFQTSMIELGVLAVLILVMVISIWLLRRGGLKE
jgi:phosphate starvation-inducible membrane PsiE